MRVLKAGGTSQKELLTYAIWHAPSPVWGIALNHKASHDDNMSGWMLCAGPVCPDSRFALLEEMAVQALAYFCPSWLAPAPVTSSPYVVSLSAVFGRGVFLGINSLCDNRPRKKAMRGGPGIAVKC